MLMEICQIPSNFVGIVYYMWLKVMTTNDRINKNTEKSYFTLGGI